MEITCTKCNSSFVLPDDRVPEAKKFKLNCPKCREPIIVDTSFSEVHVAPEHFPRDAKVVFLFLPDVQLRLRISEFFKYKEIYVSEASNIVEAMDKIAINYYHIMVVDDSIHTQSLLKVIRKWNGLRRREINIIQIGTDCPSLHEAEAFSRGVNTVINKNDVEKIEHFLELALNEFENYIDIWKSAELNIRSSAGRS